MTKVVVNGVELEYVVGITISPDNTKVVQLVLEDNKLKLKDGTPEIIEKEFNCILDTIVVDIVTDDKK